MKKIWRYSLCLACILALLLVSAPAGALAAEPEDPFVVEDGVLVEYKGYSGPGPDIIVVIPDTVTSIGSGVFSYMRLDSVIIPDSVTEMGVNLFELSTELTSVTLPSSLTEIPQGTFWNCRGLIDVSIPESVTVIGNFAFAGCESLPRLFLPDGVTKMEKDTFYASDFPLYCRDGTYAADFIEQNGLHRGYYGDVNEDGRLNSSDARLVLQHTVELVDLSPAERLIADISDDGEVNSTDARRILQAAVAA